MATNDVLSLAEAKSALNLSGTTAYDTELPGWITGVSRLLDKCVGPVVRRTVTDERHDGGTGVIRTRKYPVYAWTSVTEYEGLTATILTVETNLVQPDSAYLPERYTPDPTLYSGTLWRRAAGAAMTYPKGTGNVWVTYTAGRYENTEGIAEDFKTAAKLTLMNLWASQRPNVAQVGEFEIPQSNYPAWSVPNAAKELLIDEWQTDPRKGPLLVG